MKELPQIVQQRRISKKSKISVSPRNLLEGYIHNISLSSSTGIKAPTQIEDGNFRLSTRFLGHHSTALNQPFRKKKKKKITLPASLTPKVAYKIVRQFRTLERESSIFAWCCKLQCFSLFGLIVHKVLSQFQSSVLFSVSSLHLLEVADLLPLGSKSFISHSQSVSPTCTLAYFMSDHDSPRS